MGRWSWSFRASLLAVGRGGGGDTAGIVRGVRVGFRKCRALFALAPRGPMLPGVQRAFGKARRDGPRIGRVRGSGSKESHRRRIDVEAIREIKVEGWRITGVVAYFLGDKRSIDWVLG